MVIRRPRPRALPLRRRWFMHFFGLLLVGAIVSSPAAAQEPVPDDVSAVDEYAPSLPASEGPRRGETTRPGGGGQPRGGPGETRGRPLSSAARRRLAGSSGGGSLIALATSPSLGAPRLVASARGSAPGLESDPSPGIGAAGGSGGGQGAGLGPGRSTESAIGMSSGVPGESFEDQAKRSGRSGLGAVGGAIGSLVERTGSFLPVLLTVLGLIAAAVIVVIRRRRLSTL